MAGIYFHIPFCKQACNYCDFHFVTTLRQKEPLVKCLIKELEIRASEVNEPIETIYFGGGTPSLLSETDLNQLLQTVNTFFTVVKDAEITLEANPDDIHSKSLKCWKNVGINRLSIGIQSFQAEELSAMNRAHNAKEAKQAVELARSAGINNLSIDLIYALPFSSFERWKKNLAIALELNVPHISAYGLTIEPQTNFGYKYQQGTLSQLLDQQSNKQFEYLMAELTKNGYNHYEISNFAFDGCESKHNSSYWNGSLYLGIGPSAHGYNGKQRYFNVANNRKYINGIQSGELEQTIETLSIQDKYNDYVLTRLRTAQGIDLKEVEAFFGPTFISYIHAEAEPAKNQKLLIQDGQFLRLTHQGKFLADHVCATLFNTNENE